MSELAIAAHDLDKSFEGGRIAALAGMSLEVEPGEFVAVVGPSGCGKSTLLHLLAGLDTPDRGSILVGGHDVAAGQSLSHYRSRHVGMVFQLHNLVPTLTASENVQLPMFELGLADKARSFPDALSGGQKQRVAIARALAMEPKLMLFDEPTSALDPEMIREVLDVMRDLARDGMTMAVVTHEMGFAREVCDRLVFIDDGRIVEEAPPAEFFSAARSDRAREFVDKIIHH